MGKVIGIDLGTTNSCLQRMESDWLARLQRGRQQSMWIEHFSQ